MFKSFFAKKVVKREALFYPTFHGEWKTLTSEVCDNHQKYECLFSASSSSSLSSFSSSSYYPSDF